MNMRQSHNETERIKKIAAKMIIPPINNKWFTIFFDKPSPKILLDKAQTNCVGQHIAFDGMATYLDVCSAADRLAKECGEVCVFLGKDAGKLVLRYLNGVVQ